MDVEYNIIFIQSSQPIAPPRHRVHLGKSRKIATPEYLLTAPGEIFPGAWASHRRKHMESHSIVADAKLNLFNFVVRTMGRNGQLSDQLNPAISIYQVQSHMWKTGWFVVWTGLAWFPQTTSRWPYRAFSILSRYTSLGHQRLVKYINKVFVQG